MSEPFKKFFPLRQDDDSGGAGFETAFAVSVFFSAVSAVLTALNVWKQYRFMAATTFFLAAGFLCSAWFARKKKLFASRVATAALCGVVFSVYAVKWGNFGFAILWILLVPIVGNMLIGMRLGFLLSLYFEVFLILFFYTPLFGGARDAYTPTFVMRFPLLYTASFISVTLLMIQRQRLFIEIHHLAYYDAMTNLFNRHRYNEIIEEERKNPGSSSYSVLTFDLNRLKYYNDTAGHEAGDEMIRAAGEIIRGAFAEDECFRTGGDEFAVISVRSAGELSRSVSGFRSAMASWKGTLVPGINLSAGAAFREKNPGMSFLELCRLADRNMYTEKQEYYRKNGFERRSGR